MTAATDSHLRVGRRICNPRPPESELTHHVRVHTPRRSTPTSGRLARWAAPLLFVGLLALYASSVNLDASSNDTYSAGLGAWTIATTGEPWLDALDEGTYDEDKPWVQVNERNDRLTVSRAPGPVAAGIPAEVVRNAVSDADEFSLLPQAITAATLTALAAMLLFLSLRTRLPLLPSLVASLSFALATPVWSISGDALWTHPVTLLGILGMAYFAARERWWLVGAFGAVAVLGRLHTALIVATLGCGMAVVRRRPMIAVQVGTTSLLGVVLASLWTFWLYGRWSPTGGYRADTATRITTGFTGSSDGPLVNQLGMWLSPGYGILVWTPVLLLLLPAAVRGWHEVPTWARLLPIGGLAYTLAQAQLNTFTGGDGFFGYRHGLEFLATVTPAVAFAATGHLGRVSRPLLGPVLGLQLAVFAIGATSEAWFILFTEAWTNNSLALALRYEPEYGVLLALAVIIGYLAGRVWQERSAASAPQQEPTLTG